MKSCETVAASEPKHSGSSEPPLLLTLFGEFALNTHDAGKVRISARKSRALLSYLALRPGRPVGRERLAALLWGESDEALARSSLRQGLAALRRELPASLEARLDADNEAVTLSDGALSVDVLEFLRGLAKNDVANLREALALYRGDFVAGLTVRSDGFDDWVRQERAALRRRAADALFRLAIALADSGDDWGQEDALRRLIALEPLDERPRRALMELHARHGRHGEALDEYRRLAETLRRELGVAPEAATEALRGALVLKRKERALPGTSDAGTEPAAAARPSPPPPLEELRDIAVVALRLGCLSAPESGLDAETEARLATELHARSRDVITRAGGNCASAAGGDVLGVFGVAVSRGDETLRGVRVARELAKALGALEPRAVWTTLRFGVACGQALTGAEMLAGRPFAAALSLLSAARDGEVLVTDSVARSLADRLDLEPGDDERGHFRRVHALREPSAATAPKFVGRDGELAQLDSALASAAATGRGRVLAVRGEPGIGKSALLREFQRRARARGVAVHAAEVLDFGQASDRGLLAALTLGLLGGSRSLSTSERTAIVRDAVLDGRADSADLALLCELLLLPLGEDAKALTQAVDPKAHQRARRQALARLVLAATARSPVVLVIEDLHWAGVEERELVGEIAALAARAPLLAVLSSRSETDLFDAAFRAKARGCPTASLDLVPLSEADALSLSRAHTGLPDAVIRSCVARAEGLPLFLDQLLRAAAAGESSLPSSIRAVVQARLDRLARPSAELALAAAVLGQRVAWDALAYVAEREEPDWDELTATGLVRIDDRELVFSHALFRDAIHDSLSRSTRERLHARAAAWFRQSDAMLSAEHLAAAGDPGAAEAFFRASRAEADAHRSDRAERCAERGRSLASEPRTLYAANCLLGEIRLHSGRILDALSLFREALGVAGDDRERARAQLGVAGALRILDRYDEALEALSSAERLAAPDDFAFLARVYGLRGNVCFSLSFEACLAAHQTALDFARRAGASADEVRAEGGLGDAHYQRGSMRTARRHFARAVAACRRLEQLGLLLSYLPMLALTRAYDGDLDRGALDDALEASALATRVGSPRAELLAHLCLSTLHQFRAEYDAAHEHAELGLELARSLGARRFEAEALGVIGAAELGLGRRDAASESLRAACELAEPAHLAYCGPFVFGLRALATSDEAERERSLSRGRELLSSGAIGSNAVDFYANAIEAYLSARRWGEVRTAADALERSTQGEPLVWSSLVVRRGHLLAAAHEGLVAPDRTAMAALAAEIRSAGFFGMLPALSAFL